MEASKMDCFMLSSMLAVTRMGSVIGLAEFPFYMTVVNGCTFLSTEFYL